MTANNCTSVVDRPYASVPEDIYSIFTIILHVLRARVRVYVWVWMSGWEREGDGG